MTGSDTFEVNAESILADNFLFNSPYGKNPKLIS